MMYDWFLQKNRTNILYELIVVYLFFNKIKVKTIII